MAITGPIGPTAIAFQQQIIPKILMQLPTKPTKKTSGQKFCSLIQIGVEIKTIRIFIRPKVKYVTLDGLNPILSYVMYLVRILFHVRHIGKAHAQRMGTHGSISYFSTTLSYDPSKFLEFKTRIHAVIASNPIIWKYCNFQPKNM